MFAVVEHDKYKIVRPDCWVFPLFLMSIHVGDILTGFVTGHLFSFFVPSVQCLLLPGACIFLDMISEVISHWLFPRVERITAQSNPASFVLQVRVIALRFSNST